MEKERTVIHLEINGEHHYYGSIKRMCADYGSETLGVSYNTLRNYGLKIDKPYTNARCTIRKGVLLSQPDKRTTAKSSEI